VKKKTKQGKKRGGGLREAIVETRTELKGVLQNSDGQSPGNHESGLGEKKNNHSDGL